jgi:Flavodoxin-like fold
LTLSVLDTSVASALTKTAETPVLCWILGRRLEELHLTATVVYEIARGIERLPASRKRRELEATLDGEVLSLFDTVLLRGKQAMVAVTTGTSADTYAPDGIDGAIQDILWPIHNGLFRYCGFDVLEPFVAFMPGRLAPEERAECLGNYRHRLLALEETPRLFFHSAADYGPNERLKPGIAARSGFQRNV